MESLHELVTRLSSGFLSIASGNQNLFINDIPGDLAVEHNREWIASVISGMIASAVNGTRGAAIRFTAKKFGPILVLEVHESGQAETYPGTLEIQQMQNLAERIGGCLFINTQERERTIMSFSFPAIPAAA